MILHNSVEDFEALIRVTANFIGIPEVAVKRDYYITMILKSLNDSEYSDCVVFKGGTSLSKSYPHSIERFSEDIDLTYEPSLDPNGQDVSLSDKQKGRRIKKIEEALSNGFMFEIIPEDRNDTNKSSYVWHEQEDKELGIKLEIGCSVKPHPVEKRVLRSYIHDYLLFNSLHDEIDEFGLVDITINVLKIERTFIDKVMAIKRHAMNNNIANKVRHIYDVVKLYNYPDVSKFLLNHGELKEILSLTKNTDSFYLQKRDINPHYNPTGPYDLDNWIHHIMTAEITKRYENLHEDLLYTNKKQDFNLAIDTLKKLNDLFKSINE